MRQSNYIELLMEIVNRYYRPFIRKERKVVWLSAFTPSEIIKCFDVDLFYPESYAAVLSSRKMGEEMLSKAVSLGYNDSVCSYMRIFDGALHSRGPLPYGKIPRPDALVATNNQCDTMFLMWRLLAQRYHVPLFIVDLPPGDNQDGRRTYIRSQFLNLIRFMETLTGKDVDARVLKERTRNSSMISSLWGMLCEDVFMEKRCLTLQSLINSFLFPVVCAHSEAITVRFLESCIGQIEKKHEMDDGKKIYWFGYPFWFMNRKLPDLSPCNGRIVANNYIQWWNMLIDNQEKPLDALAEAYANTYLNQPLEEKLLMLEKDVRRYSIDGVIVHSNASCKRDSIISKKIVDELHIRGVPSLEIQGDMCDRNKFQEKRFMAQAEAFLEGV